MQPESTGSTLLNTPSALFTRELSEARSAETLVLEMLQLAAPMIRGGVREAVERHLLETERHIQRIDEVLRMSGAKEMPVTCHAARGLLTSFNEALAAGANGEPGELIVLLGASKTEYLEIAIYNGLVQMARGLGRGDASDLLQQTLEEENAMRQQVDAELFELAQNLDIMAGMSERSVNNATLHGYQ